MKDIVDVDKNFLVKTKIDKEDIVFYDPRKTPFQLFGLFYEDGKFRRFPEEIARTVSDEVNLLHSRTAGGRLRFRTDSPYIAISVKMGGVSKIPHFTLIGSAGFDLYVRENGKETFYGIFKPTFATIEEYEYLIDFKTKMPRELTIHFPQYSEVCELYLGVSDDAVIEPPTPYKSQMPIVYYGSSITQGGCASRPGNAYPNIISRRFDCDYINLGFAGSAKAEREIAEYISQMDMSLFVYDYDWNALNTEDLSNTHEKMFKTIRSANPTLPIIIMSRPKINLDDEEKERLDIIRTTYNHAVASGDQNVYFIPGTKLMEMAGTDGTVDGIHPNDLGFASIAKALGDEIEKIHCL